MTSAPTQSAHRWVDAHGDELSAWTRAIWELAEPAWREYRSAAWFVERLRAEGFEVEAPSGGMPTAFSATLDERRRADRADLRGVRRGARQQPGRGDHTRAAARDHALRGRPHRPALRARDRRARRRCWPPRTRWRPTAWRGRCGSPASRPRRCRARRSCTACAATTTGSTRSSPATPSTCCRCATPSAGTPTAAPTTAASTRSWPPSRPTGRPRRAADRSRRRTPPPGRRGRTSP